MTIALGPESQLTCMMMFRQADLESDFAHYALAEKLDRLALKGLASEGEVLMTLRVREQLVRALSYQGGTNKKEEALRLAQGNVPLAEKLDEKKHSMHHEELVYALDWLAYSYGGCKQIDKANETYEKMIALLQSNPRKVQAIADALLAEARLEKERKNFEAAQVLYERAIKANPGATGPYFARAASFRDRGKDELAIADYQTIIRLEPKKRSTWRILAKMYDEKGAVAKALECADAFVKLDPKISSGYALRAEILEKSGQLDQAIADATKAVDACNPKDVNAAGGYHIDRGNIYLHAGKYKEALSDFGLALATLSDSSYCLRCRADTYEKLHDYQKEIDDLGAAIKIEMVHNETSASDYYSDSYGPPYAIKLYEQRARAYKALGKKSQAAGDDQAAAKLKADWQKKRVANPAESE
ncbi:MAG: hypothetical protein KGS72_21860 [Cyanobacteria bacterium REEB67]|nr:hypothetical protein [Cyanobacteria bacterium REEB67]